MIYTKYNKQNQTSEQQMACVCSRVLGRQSKGVQSALDGTSNGVVVTFCNVSGAVAVGHVVNQNLLAISFVVELAPQITMRWLSLAPRVFVFAAPASPDGSQQELFGTHHTRVLSVLSPIVANPRTTVR